MGEINQLSSLIFDLFTQWYSDNQPMIIALTHTHQVYSAECINLA